MAAKAKISYTRLKKICSFVAARSNVSYQHVRAAGLFLDAYPLNQYLTDSVALADVPAFSLTKPLTETITVTDLPAFSLSKPVSDGISIADSFSYLLFINRTFTESVSLSESQTFVINKALSDSISLTDAFNASFITEFTPDSFTLADSPSIDVNGNPTESISLSEEVAIQSEKAVSDSFGFNESFQAGFNLTQDINNIVSVSDNFQFLLISGNNAVLNTSALNTFTLNG
tara:strand:- start:130 stop:819 length:690 start_codon:yes stop_codon:yes gene_type:complete